VISDSQLKHLLYDIFYNFDFDTEKLYAMLEQQIRDLPAENRHQMDTEVLRLLGDLNPNNHRW
jgi:hypothetical protein